MLRVGQEEIKAIGEVLKSGKMFRYHPGGQCDRFEKRYAKFLGVKHVCMTASGTNALTAALAGLGIGPGDEVVVPSFTYMATAIAVVAVGAIPVIIDVDESTLMDPNALDDAVGPRTRAVIPVHMWGLPCDMRRILKVARKHQLLVLEDACQGVGGAYEGRKLGTLGHAGAFSFNYFKNMTCGEGGAVVTSGSPVFEKARCMIDCCSFYWKGRKATFTPFVSNGARASEIEGAMMNVQLDRVPGLLRATRAQKKRILRETARTGLQASPCHSLDHECGTHVLYLLPTEKQAQDFATQVGCGIAGRTGRHVYTEWDPIFALQGAHHEAMNPFRFPENRGCRRKYTRDMCARSLDILNRTVMIGTHPDRTREEVTTRIQKIQEAASRVLGT
ncbi:MAG: DegT/DnrJ/EryC1/StrS family aminotransferase [Planctomycetes bacterium]|nr:DegT/DnrJ/EryC1/StrS family aminotransferase [Planctomycetota bacterium]